MGDVLLSWLDSWAIQEAVSGWVVMLVAVLANFVRAH